MTTEAPKHLVLKSLNTLLHYSIETGDKVLRDALIISCSRLANELFSELGRRFKPKDSSTDDRE